MTDIFDQEFVDRFMQNVPTADELARRPMTPELLKLFSDLDRMRHNPRIRKELDRLPEDDIISDPDDQLDVDDFLEL